MHQLRGGVRGAVRRGFTYPQDGGVRRHHLDADGKEDWTITDSHGRVVRTADGLGTETCHTYGAFANHTGTSVDCGLGGTPRATGFTYTGLGLLETEDDPVTGTREYGYNGFGDLTYRSDGNGTETDILVDELGRTRQIRSGSHVDTFVWDTMLYGALGQTDSADGVHRSYDYDQYGRLSDATTTGLDGGYTYHTTYTHDDADRLTSVTFPRVLSSVAPVTLEYQYDQAGYQRAIVRPATGEALWAAIDSFPSGFIIHERFGDDIDTYRDQDAETLRPTALVTMYTPTATPLQNMSYAWTFGGELDDRRDLVNGQDESFTYDAAHRLLTAEVDQGSSSKTQTVTYDPDGYGDIIHKSDIGDYSYYTDGRLRTYGKGGPTLGYDGNGNVITRGAQTLTYTPFEKVASINGDGADLQFRFDAEGQRMVRVDAANDTTVVTLDGMYSAEVDHDGGRWERISFPTPTGAAVRIDQLVTSGNLFVDRTRFLHPTYLGSGNLISEPDGTIFAAASFDSWGAVRNSTDWMDAKAVPDETTLADLQTGFTGHKARMDAELIDMGGRMYDPKLGRFLQRDPLIANPANGASYNKYSYVENRPLRLVDPTGYAAEGGEGDGGSSDGEGENASGDVGSEGQDEDDAGIAITGIWIYLELLVAFSEWCNSQAQGKVASEASAMRGGSGLSVADVKYLLEQCRDGGTVQACIAAAAQPLLDKVWADGATMQRTEKQVIEGRDKNALEHAKQVGLIFAEAAVLEAVIAASGAIFAGRLARFARLEGNSARAAGGSAGAMKTVEFGANAATKLRKHAQHIRETARRLGVEIPKGPGKPATRRAMEDFITSVAARGETQIGRYMSVAEAQWSRLGDAIVVQQLDGTFITFLDAAKGGAALAFPGGL